MFFIAATLYAYAVFTFKVIHHSVTELYYHNDFDIDGYYRDRDYMRDHGPYIRVLYNYLFEDIQLNKQNVPYTPYKSIIELVALHTGNAFDACPNPDYIPPVPIEAFKLNFGMIFASIVTLGACLCSQPDTFKFLLEAVFYIYRRLSTAGNYNTAPIDTLRLVPAYVWSVFNSYALCKYATVLPEHAGRDTTIARRHHSSALIVYRQPTRFTALARPSNMIEYDDLLQIFMVLICISSYSASHLLENPVNNISTVISTRNTSNSYSNYARPRSSSTHQPHHSNGWYHVSENYYMNDSYTIYVITVSVFTGGSYFSKTRVTIFFGDIFSEPEPLLGSAQDYITFTPTVVHPYGSAVAPSILSLPWYPTTRAISSTRLPTLPCPIRTPRRIQMNSFYPSDCYSQVRPSSIQTMIHLTQPTAVIRSLSQHIPSHSVAKFPRSSKLLAPVECKQTPILLADAVRLQLAASIPSWNSGYNLVRNLPGLCNASLVSIQSARSEQSDSGKQFSHGIAAPPTGLVASKSFEIPTLGLSPSEENLPVAPLPDTLPCVSVPVPAGKCLQDDVLAVPQPSVTSLVPLPLSARLACLNCDTATTSSMTPDDYCWGLDTAALAAATSVLNIPTRELPPDTSATDLVCMIRKSVNELRNIPDPDFVDDSPYVPYFGKDLESIGEPPRGFRTKSTCPGELRPAKSKDFGRGDRTVWLQALNGLKCDRSRARNPRSVSERPQRCLPAG